MIDPYSVAGVDPWSLPGAALLGGPKRFSNDRSSAVRFLEQGEWHLYPPTRGVSSLRKPPHHWARARQQIKCRDDFYHLILDSRRAGLEEAREIARLKLYGRVGWPKQLYEERRILTGNRARAAWTTKLQRAPDANARRAILDRSLASHEDTESGWRITIRVSDVLDRVFDRRGKNRTPSCETSAGLIGTWLRGLGVSETVAAALASDILLWFVTGEKINPDAIRKRWRREEVRSGPSPSVRWLTSKPERPS